MTVICGIDPGLKGAFAFIDTKFSTLSIIDMPVVAKNSKNHVDPSEVGRILASRDIDTIVLEHVHSSPQMGVASSFAFGRSAGIILGAAGALSIELTEIVPSVWKPRMGCTSDKKQTRERATQLIPACATAWKLAKHDGRAEAALIGLFGAISLGHTIKNLTLKT